MQLAEAKINAMTPTLSMAAPPRLSAWFISTATPQTPVSSATARSMVSRCVPGKII
jgi:hypothetical protein